VTCLHETASLLTYNTVMTFCCVTV